MLKKIDHESMGKSNLGWLKSVFHFSFAEYYNPENMKFGVLRVINDDLIQSGTGFETHPHRDMEIVSYVIDGELTHGDSMGNKETITRGQVQYMSAGTGVYHSEHNLGSSTARLLQIWILPDRKGHAPKYGDFRFKWEDRKGKWLHMVSSDTGTAPVQIFQDANIYVTEIEPDHTLTFKVEPGRQAYLVEIEGKSLINEIPMNSRDAMEIVEEDIMIVANEKSHIMIIEMAKAI